MFSRENRKKKMEKKIGLRVWFYILCSLFFSFSSFAQCAMCRAALSSEGNKAKAAAVNDGIVYLMVIPYLLVGAIGYAVYRMRKNKSK
jgi:heme/copper-type cytochrome/quinol oxidase subunit 3